MRVGIIGMGDGGRCNLKGLRMAEAEVVAVCDRDRRVLEGFFTGDGVDVVNSVPRLLARRDVELVVVATPDDKHVRLVEAVLRTGRYVFLEKPAATTVKGIQQLAKLANLYRGRILFSEKYSFANPVEAALEYREELGEFLCGTTHYMMWKCDRIMGGGKWRTECAYNPCAGGLSHNFMTALLFTSSLIRRVRSTGDVLMYHDNLDRFRGYDTMEGTLEFESGRMLTWVVCLAVKGADSPYRHRTVAHTFQFENGSLAYGPEPESDRLIVQGKRIDFPRESDSECWGDYNSGCYMLMHKDLFASLRTGRCARHDIAQGLNVALACALAMKSARRGGRWINLPRI